MVVLLITHLCQRLLARAQPEAQLALALDPVVREGVGDHEPTLVILLERVDEPPGRCKMI